MEVCIAFYQIIKVSVKIVADVQYSPFALCFEKYAKGAILHDSFEYLLINFLSEQNEF